MAIYRSLSMKTQTVVLSKRTKKTSPRLTYNGRIRHHRYIYAHHIMFSSQIYIHGVIIEIKKFKLVFLFITSNIGFIIYL